jgi:nitrite reductase/ring-hydroxylating ferredoxin subunit
MAKGLISPNLIKIFLITLFLNTYISCDTNTTPIVPEVPVYIELSLTADLAYLGTGMVVAVYPDSINENYTIIDYHNPKFPKKRITYKTYGNGVLIYQRDKDDYQAFDATCTYRAYDDYCKLSIDSDRWKGVCPCCGSEFVFISEGAPTNTSKAYKPLMQYQTTIRSNYLIISK